MGKEIYCILRSPASADAFLNGQYFKEISASMVKAMPMLTHPIDSKIPLK